MEQILVSLQLWQWLFINQISSTCIRNSCYYFWEPHPTWEHQMLEVVSTYIFFHFLCLLLFYQQYFGQNWSIRFAGGIICLLQKCYSWNFSSSQYWAWLFLFHGQIFDPRHGRTKIIRASLHDVTWL